MRVSKASVWDLVKKMIGNNRLEEARLIRLTGGACTIQTNKPIEFEDIAKLRLNEFHRDPYIMALGDGIRVMHTNSSISSVSSLSLYNGQVTTLSKRMDACKITIPLGSTAIIW